MTDAAPGQWAKTLRGYTITMTGLPRTDGHNVAITCGELRAAAAALTTAQARIAELEAALRGVLDCFEDIAGDASDKVQAAEELEAVAAARRALEAKP